MPERSSHRETAAKTTEMKKKANRVDNDPSALRLPFLLPIVEGKKKKKCCHKYKKGKRCKKCPDL